MSLTIAIIILIILGIFLVLLEIIIPGGVLGAMGGLCVLAAIGFAFYKDVSLGLGLLVGAIIFFAVAFWAWLKYLHRLPIAKEMFLKDTAKDRHGTNQKNKEWIGREGLAQTTLRPSGFATIDDERVDVVTEGEMIDQGEAVTVIKVEGNRIVVAKSDSPMAQHRRQTSAPDPDETQAPEC